MTIKIILILLAVIIIACIAVIYHDMTHFVVREYEIHSDKIAKDAVFCLLSDLHEKDYGDGNSKLVEAINEINPDIVLMSGDMITGHNKHHSLNAGPALKLISKIIDKYPVYAANGNHEYKTSILEGRGSELYREYDKALTDLGVNMLHNIGTYLEEFNMEIHGLETSYEYYRKFFKAKMDPSYIIDFFGVPCSERFQLLIAHNPVYFEEYCEWGADLTVSGHVHGGIARVPLLGGVLSPALMLFPKYDGGLFKNGDKYMVLSRGLGMHTVPIRFNNPGELCVIRVYSDKKK
ncbi:metallophosphoesterase [Butyrivibrio sp. WCD3002]|uniref:metallophosphoesterase n=1 Tax=Butyrivibrio sp. WCD3002 TaxID=1280676 RepID=UPI00040A4900|nr:metallophosphoesterase [Butyrivibrio sp. WCD3002]